MSTPNPFERGPAAAPAGKAAQAPRNAPAAKANTAAAGIGGVDTKQSEDPYSVSVPAGISGLRMSEPGIMDELLLVEPVEYIPSMRTTASPEPTDVFRVNILPLTGELANELQEDVLIFQEALKRELKKTYEGPNRWLLAFHHLGEAKPGKNAPYLFTPPDEDQMAIFEKWKAAQSATAR